MINNFKYGFKANLPISISVLAYGIVLGVICTSKSITFLQLALMNIFIFAGSSQFVIVDMITNPINLSIIIGSALLINLRYFLITASLNDFFKNSSINKKALFVHFVTDESWAVAMNKKRSDLLVYLITAFFAIILERNISNMSYIIVSSLIGCYVYVYINKKRSYE